MNITMISAIRNGISLTEIRSSFSPVTEDSTQELRRLRSQMATMSAQNDRLVRTLKDVGYDVFIDDAEVIEVGRLRLHAIHNPGHTPGSVSFRVEGAPLLFTGDTLFPGGPGNTSFEGGDFATIIDSIDSKLFTMPAETIVMPGHGVSTTIGAERPHLQEWVARGW